MGGAQKEWGQSLKRVPAAESERVWTEQCWKMQRVLACVGLCVCFFLMCVVTSRVNDFKYVLFLLLLLLLFCFLLHS